MPKKSKDAFKAAFGLKNTSTDWEKIRKAMDKGLAKMDASVQKLESYGTHDAQPLRVAFTSLQTEASLLRSAFARDAAGTGPSIRDTFLPKLQVQMTAAKKATNDTPNRVTGAGGAQVEVFRSDVPGFEGMNQQARNQALQLAADKVERGMALIQTLKPAANQGANQASPQDCVDLVWALKSAAQAKRGAYEKGALTAPYGQELREFLDSCAAEVYPRSSSHLSEQADEQGAGISGQTTRGLDFYNDAQNPNKMLPAGMNTVLYQQVKGTDGRTMLYVKMETEGAIGSGGSNHLIDNTAPAARPARPGDTGALIAHGKNWVVKKATGGVASNKELGTAREDVPSGIKAKCEEIMKDWPSKPGRARIRAAMAGELRLNKFFAAIETNLQTEGIGAPLTQKIADFQTDLLAKYQVSEIESMFGEEVQLGDNDI